MSELILKDEVYEIAGSAMDVFYTMGPGFLEPVYHEAMNVEMKRRNIPFESEKELDLYYKGIKLEKKYFADFVCFDQIVIELKVVPGITNIEVAQLINYLKITKTRVGLLFNSGSRSKLDWKRYVI
ncbi:MAG: GxxExxY protein [Acidobacteriota bacterium]